MRAHRAGIGARVGLGQAEAADQLAAVHRRQPALLLLLRAPAPDREHRERALDRDGAAHTRVAGLELHAGDAVGDGARAGQAVALEVHAHQAEARKLGVDLPRQQALLEPLADLGQDALADELAHRVADRALLLGEESVDGEEVAGVELGRCGRLRRDAKEPSSARERRERGVDVVLRVVEVERRA